MAHRAQLVLSRYSLKWPEEFESERLLIAEATRAFDFRLEHVGSTSVPGLAAKAIIDMMLGATTLKEIESSVSVFQELGYEYISAHESVMPFRRFFAKPTIRPRRFHLHAVVKDGAFWREHIIFRDALRADFNVASEYALLKQRLAIEFGNDREGYTEAKSPFIKAAIRNVHPSTEA